MAKLTYAAIASLDGYVADRDGNFDWAAPDEEVHAFVNELERPIGTYLYGRRMYDVMAYWETADLSDEPDAVRRYADIWRSADKIVYSRTLDDVRTERTRLERSFDPDVIRQMKASVERDIGVGGPELAGRALAAGLVDECHVLLVPVVVGGGTRFLPDDVRFRLDLRDHRDFGNGTVHLHYGIVDRTALR